MVLAGSCQADGTCNISERFVMDVSPVIASPWGCLFQLIISFLSGFGRGFGRTSCTWNSSETKNDLQAVFAAACVLWVNHSGYVDVSQSITLVPFHLHLSVSHKHSSISSFGICASESFHLRWRKVYVQMWFNRSALLLQKGWGKVWSCWKICFGTQIIDSASRFSKGARSPVIVSAAALHSNSGIELCTWWEMNNSPTQRNAEILLYSGAKKCQECEHFMLP